MGVRRVYICDICGKEFSDEDNLWWLTLKSSDSHDPANLEGNDTCRDCGEAIRKTIETLKNKGV